MRATLTTVTAIGLMAIPTTAYGHGVDIDVLSSRADQVSGGDALVRVEAPKGLMKRLRVERNGTDITSAFARRDGALEGLVEGLRVGANELTVTHKRHRVARERLVNHPITGPIFSGPQQAPFVCKTNQPQPPLNDNLGEPLVDNQAGDGFRVLAPDGTTAGYSRDCSARTVVDHLYRTTANTWKAAAERRPTRGHGHDDDARRPHRRLRDPPRARHDQPLPLLLPRCSPTAPGTAASSTPSTAASRSAVIRGRSAAPRWTRSCSGSGTRSRTPAARAPASTTTSSSAARPR